MPFPDSQRRVLTTPSGLRLPGNETSNLKLDCQRIHSVDTSEMLPHRLFLA